MTGVLTKRLLYKCRLPIALKKRRFPTPLPSAPRAPPPESSPPRAPSPLPSAPRAPRPELSPPRAPSPLPSAPRAPPPESSPPRAPSPLPSAPRVPSPEPLRKTVTFVLENTGLLSVEIGKKAVILDPRFKKHRKHATDRKWNLSQFQPELIYEAVKIIMGSSLRTAGLLGGVYLKTHEKHLVEINSDWIAPANLQEFCSDMVDVLGTFDGRGAGRRGGGRNAGAMRLVKNPVEDHFPVGSLKIALSSRSETLVAVEEYLNEKKHFPDIVFTVEALECGTVLGDYIEERISVSRSRLSTCECLTAVISALEKSMLNA